MKKFIVLIAILLLAFTVSVTAQEDCAITVPEPDSVSAFLDSIPELNDQLSSCPQKLEGPAGTMLGSEVIQVDITMQSGSTESFTVTTRDKMFVAIMGTAAEKPGFTISVDECALNTALSAENKGGVFAYLYQDGRVTLEAHGFWKKLKYGIIKPFVKGAVNRFATPVEVSC